jgi:thymidylate synthase
MQQYLDILDRILYKGVDSDDRTGTGTLKVFGERMCFDLQAGFPLITTKFIPFKLVAGELLWFIQGGRNRNLNIHDLQKLTPGNNIWNEWATDAGDLGPVYGVQWRSWPRKDVICPDATAFGKPVPMELNYIDQLQGVIRTIRDDPEGRRHIVSSWNVAELEDMRLPPCHILFQFYVAEGKLSCQLYQRSCDMFLGVPFNIASYALLTHMVAHICDLEVDKFIWIGGDCHIYTNHIDQVTIQLGRAPKKPLPTLVLNRKLFEIDDFKLEDFSIEDYFYHPHISGPISV